MEALVYFVQQGRDGPVKIGTAADPESRLFELQIGNPRELRLVAAVGGGLPLERELQRKFAGGLIRGEWFAPDTIGLAEEMAAACHLESLAELWECGWCPRCTRRPVRHGRTYCDDDCSSASARQRSRDWKRERKAAA